MKQKEAFIKALYAFLAPHFSCTTFVDLHEREMLLHGSIVKNVYTHFVISWSCKLSRICTKYGKFRVLLITFSGFFLSLEVEFCDYHYVMTV